MTTASSASAAHENRLALETSPYLLQHRHNPVDWWAWGPDALNAAKQSNKPILLSIGYAACHWCHVMAHESFEDAPTAAVMNDLFINIKVDREERPDIDQIYMAALHHLGEQGGWPLTMFLTPDGEPVWGGTYFPKVSRYGRPGFVDVMQEVARLFREEPQRIEHNRNALMTALANKSRPANQVVIGARELDATATAIARAFDPVNGGFGRAPKFPQCSMLEVLWRAGMRRGEARFFELVEHTLTHMCEGGIYDHLGGGFSRYSVDERWLVPHFEKMLYDNAQLLELLALAHVRSGNDLFRQRAEETVGWLAREMTTPQGAFCASLDADSEGEEGKFYVWSRAEIEDILGPRDAEFFALTYDVTPGGNFEGHNILNRLAALTDTQDNTEKNNTQKDKPREGASEARIVKDPGPPTNGHAGEGAQLPDADYLLAQKRRADKVTRLAGLRQQLLAARANRVRPGLDDKVLADWNGLMIAALVNAGVMLQQPQWIELAKRAFAFIAQHMTRGDRLGHSWRDGKLLLPGLASDYAAMIRAALALHEATGAREYLAAALAWQAALDRHYAHEANGGYYLTANDAEGLGGASGFDDRRSDSERQRVGRSESDAPRHPFRRRHLAGARRHPVRRPAADRGGKHVSACQPAQRARSAAARRRDRRGGPASRPVRRRGARDAVPRPHRGACREQRRTAVAPPRARRLPRLGWNRRPRMRGRALLPAGNRRRQAGGSSRSGAGTARAIVSGEPPDHWVRAAKGPISGLPWVSASGPSSTFAPRAMAASLAAGLEAGEVRPVLPRQRSAQLLAGLDRGVMDDVDLPLVVGIALLVAGEIAEIAAGREDRMHARHLGDLVGVLESLQRLDHQDQHDIVVDGVAVAAGDIAPHVGIERVAATEAALAERWEIGPVPARRSLPPRCRRSERR